MYRSLEIPQSCSGVARFDFEYLCGRPVIPCSLNLHLFRIQIEGKGNYVVHDQGTVGLKKMIYGVVSVFL